MAASDHSRCAVIDGQDKPNEHNRFEPAGSTVHIRAVHCRPALPADALVFTRRLGSCLLGQHLRAVQPLATIERWRVPASTHPLQPAGRSRCPVVAGWHWILYTADHHGDEFYQVYLIPARGGQPEQLTDAEQVQHYLGQDAWSPDGSAIAYSANDRTPTEQDVLVRDMQTGEVRRVLEGDALYFASGWSPDGKRLTVVDAKSNTNQDIYLLDPATGTIDHLTPRDGEVKNFPGPWAGDSSGFYVLSDEDRDFLGMAFQDVATGQKRWVETPDWDIEHVAVSPDGRYLIWVVNEGGYSRLYVRDLNANQQVALPDVPGGVIRHLTTSRDGRKIGLLLDRPDHPTEIYVVDLDEQSVTQLTYSFLGGIDSCDLIQPEINRLPNPRWPRDSGLPLQAAGRRAIRRSSSRSTAGRKRRSGRLYMPTPGSTSTWLSRGIGSPRAEHARLDRLRQDLPDTDPPRLGRRRAEGLQVPRPLPARAGLG